MYLIASARFLFDLPVLVQKSHLIDVGHLPNAHWLTLMGTKIGTIYAKKRCASKRSIEFDLCRFGNPNRILIEQCLVTGAATVSSSSFKLEFSISEVSDSLHWLNVAFFSACRWHKLLWPLLQIVFALTVLEDRVYYYAKEAKSRKLSGRTRNIQK